MARGVDEIAHDHQRLVDALRLRRRRKLEAEFGKFRGKSGFGGHGREADEG